MKGHITKYALIAALSAGTITSIYAHEDYSEAGNTHWLSHLYEAGKAAKPSMPYGYALDVKPGREVNLTKSSRYLNVERLEIVRINVAGKSLTWKFDTASLMPFSLSKILPEAEGITVYVSENPDYQGGN